MRVSADCAKMNGWRLRFRASYNVKVHTTVVLYTVLSKSDVGMSVSAPHSKVILS